MNFQITTIIGLSSSGTIGFADPLWYLSVPVSRVNW